MLIQVLCSFSICGQRKSLAFGHDVTYVKISLIVQELAHPHRETKQNLKFNTCPYISISISQYFNVLPVLLLLLFSQAIWVEVSVCISAPVSSPYLNFSILASGFSKGKSKGIAIIPILPIDSLILQHRPLVNNSFYLQGCSLLRLGISRQFCDHFYCCLIHDL